MIVRDDIIQGTAEWHELKWGKIGGTRAHGLLVDSETLLIELLAEHLEDYEDDESYLSESMLRGMDLEALAREEVGKYIGCELIQVGWLQCEENELMGISPDGMSECMTISAEIKCPERKRHTSTIFKDEIPRDNIRQSIQYFTVNPLLEKHYFASFRPENNVKPLFVKEITLDSVVDIGLTKKVKQIRKDAKGKEKEYIVVIPDARTVREWVVANKTAADQLKKRLNQAIQKVNF